MLDLSEFLLYPKAFRSTIMSRPGPTPARKIFRSARPGPEDFLVSPARIQARMPIPEQINRCFQLFKLKLLIHSCSTKERERWWWWQKLRQTLVSSREREKGTKNIS